MTEDIPAPIAGAAQLKKLRNALAIARGRKLLSTLQQEAESTISHDQAKRVTYLTELFSRIHREIFHDWKDQATASHRPGAMPDAETRKRFRMTIEGLVLNGGGAHGTELFDSNGFVIKTRNIAERLANFYQKMRIVRPFKYGNRLTLDVFMIALANLPAFKGVYEQGIDFRRLDAKDAVALHDLMSGTDDIKTAFAHALDPNRTKCLQNAANGYGKWPENKRHVASIPFLSHVTEDGTECLVTVNGGLVPLASIKQELFVTGMQVADFPLSLSENVIGYLPGTAALRQAGKHEIDGIPIGDTGAAPLFCLDVNLLTGLRHASHTELRELLKECEGDEASVFLLANNPEIKAKLLAAADDIRLQRTVEIAYARLSKIAQKLADAQAAIFQGKIPDEHPKLFMSMGGAGSGKTAVEEIARAQCGDNFVIASLDEFRKCSDLYTVLTAANHHSDDYVFVEPFANRLRDSVADYARENRINILYDGTGIPYKPRYHTVVNTFKKAGFHTQIVAIDAFIVKPAGREHELSRAGVIRSVKDRFEKTGRALPWVVTVDKHIRSLWAFREALERESLEKIALFANDGERDRHYLVAECFAFSDQDIRDMQERQKSGELAEFLRRTGKTYSGAILKTLSLGDADKLDTLLSRNPALDETNVAYQVYHSQYGNRVLVIYNTRRMVDFVVKRQLNPNASGEEGLLHKHASLAFHVDPGSKDPWMIRLQNASSETDPYAPF
ncbi:MAG: zeta toxin family protein [Candidatus Methylumidiphilus sp.]